MIAEGSHQTSQALWYGAMGQDSPWIANPDQFLCEAKGVRVKDVGRSVAS